MLSKVCTRHSYYIPYGTKILQGIKFYGFKVVGRTVKLNEVAIGPVTGRTLYSYRSGSHVLSIFLFALILLVRVRNGVWCSVRLVLGLGIGFGLALG